MSEKLLEAKILACVEKAMRKVNERYVTADVLCEHIGTLTPRFLQDHGDMFPRQQLTWTDRNGVKHKQGWLYPLYEVKDMFLNGEIKEL
jgi:hypothetical protein